MPVIKANQQLPERPVIMVIYGDPGVSKTSIGNTCDTPILLDFDRGVDRSHGRQDTLVPESWQEVLNEETGGLFSNYKTVIIDTAKACLDDFLMVHVCEQDYKLVSNKLKAYGEIGDQFKLFVNKRRKEKADILIIAHSKKDEDTKKHIPDVTGQSYALIMRIADQVGYITVANGKRILSFEPTDTTVGKNVAGINRIEVPALGTPEFKTFGAELFNKVRSSIASMSEEQQLALKQSEDFQIRISEADDISELKDLLPEIEALPDYLKVPLINMVGEKHSEFIKITETPESLNDYITIVNSLPTYLSTGIKKVMMNHAQEQGWVLNEKKKMFEAPAGTNKDDNQTALFPDVPNVPAPQSKLFSKPCASLEEVAMQISVAVTLNDIANIYYANTGFIEENEELRKQFEDRRSELYNKKGSKAGKEAASNV